MCLSERYIKNYTIQAYKSILVAFLAAKSVLHSRCLIRINMTVMDFSIVTSICASLYPLVRS